MLTTLHLSSLEQLQEVAPQWNDLWRRTRDVVPTARVEPLSLWCRHFSTTAEFYAVVIEASGSFVAALPLVPTRIRGLVQAARLPTNEWAAGGDLLLDSAASDEVVDLLVQELTELAWPLVWLEPVALRQRRWRLFSQALDRAQVAFETDVRYWSGLLPTSGDWSEYRSRWSRNHRRKMDRHRRQLEGAGELVLRLEQPQSRADIERLVRRGFTIEDSGWKGKAASSVIAQPKLLEFYIEQACALASNRELRLAFLEHADRRIAFEYGMLSQGTYYSVKVGYDAEFANRSPGQLLLAALLERFFGEPQCRQIDCMGPLDEALRRWRPEAYPVGRLVVAPTSTWGRWIVQAYSKFWPRRDSERQREEFLAQESA